LSWTSSSRSLILLDSTLRLSSSIYRELSSAETLSFHCLIVTLYSSTSLFHLFSTSLIFLSYCWRSYFWVSCVSSPNLLMMASISLLRSRTMSSLSFFFHSYFCSSILIWYCSIHCSLETASSSLIYLMCS
jgi:hypothetical protein